MSWMDLYKIYRVQKSLTPENAKNWLRNTFSRETSLWLVFRRVFPLCCGASNTNCVCFPECVVFIFVQFYRTVYHFLFTHILHCTFTTCFQIVFLWGAQLLIFIYALILSIRQLTVCYLSFLRCVLHACTFECLIFYLSFAVLCLFVSLNI